MHDSGSAACGKAQTTYPPVKAEKAHSPGNLPFSFYVQYLTTRFSDTFTYFSAVVFRSLFEFETVNPLFLVLLFSV